MNSRVRKNATSEDIANLHRDLCQINQKILDVAIPPNEKLSALQKPEQRRMLALAKKIQCLRYDLEAPFVNATNDRSAPNSHIEQPDEWLLFLITKKITR